MSNSPGDVVPIRRDVPRTINHLTARLLDFGRYVDEHTLAVEDVAFLGTGDVHVDLSRTPQPRGAIVRWRQHLTRATFTETPLVIDGRLCVDLTVAGWACPGMFVHVVAREIVQVAR